MYNLLSKRSPRNVGVEEITNYDKETSTGSLILSGVDTVMKRRTA